MNVDVILAQSVIGEPECVSDLGVTMVKNVCFSEHNHIANITRKAHQRANLIHRCFISKNTDLSYTSQSIQNLRSSRARV